MHHALPRCRMSDPTLRRRVILLQLLVSSASKSLSYSLENAADPQQVMAGETQELEQTTVREVDAEDMAVAKEVAA